MRFMTRRHCLALLGSIGFGALSAPYVRKVRADDQVLNVYNWADYIGETTIEDFQSKTNIAVTYDTYTSSDEMQAKMLAGTTGYDVVNMSGLSMPTFNKAGIFDELDRSRLKGWSNLDPAILALLGAWDTGNRHGIPYMWGSVGFAYNVDMIKKRLPDADLESLDILFKPENAAKLADCGISMLDSSTDVLEMGLRYLGKDGDSRSVEDYKAVADLIAKIRPSIRTFDNANYVNALPNGELCLVNSWSGDYSTAKARAKEAGITVNLAYFVPRTGAPVWIDTLCIPRDASNKGAAYSFLDYMLQPEVIAKCSNFTNYANGNLASRAFLKPEVLANPAIYPTAEIMKRLWAPKPLTEQQDRDITRIWNDIRTS